MAEAVVTWVLEEIGVEFASWIAAAIVETASYVAIAASVYNLREQQRRAKSAYNNGLADRYVMQRAATAQRALVLGRARVSGPIVFMHSYGDNNTTLALCVMLAAHECDAIEEIYFNDTAVILDANGAVVGTKIVERFSINGTTATYTLGTVGTAGTASAVATYDTGTVALGVVMSGDGRTLSITGGTAGKVGSVVVTYQPYDVVYTPTRIQDSHLQQTATGSSGTFTVPASCITASVVVVDIPASGAQTVIGFSRAGNVITYTGATAGHTVHLMYQAGTTYSRARITQHLGAPGQTADAGLISALPSLWTSAHRGDGLCYLKVELDYDPSTFPNGIPNISAVVRGLKCFDPRTSTTVWTDNPALLMRAYYLHALGAGRSVSEINDASVIAAANVCDGTVTYTVGAFQQTRARYKASTVAMKDRRPQDVLTDLAHAMGGRWVVSGNQLVVKAGVFSSPVASIDATWLHTGSSVSVQPRVNRADLTNAIVGSFADEQQAWQVVAYPKVSAAAYITADGAELQARVDYPAVTYTGQAQYLSACAIRYNRSGLTVRMSCNLRAFPLEVFDVVSVTLTRFGWSAKTFEVIATGFSVEGLVELTLKEIDASIWALDAAFLATDYAVKSLLPSPWVLPVPALGTPVSGTAYLLRQADGSIVSRIYVPVTPITNTNVLQGGFIDVSYRRFGDSNDDWSTVTVPGDATGAFLAGVNDGAVYVIKARTRNRLAEGNWSQQVVHSVVGKSQPPAAVAGFALTVVPGALRGSRTPSTELDYAYSIYVYGTSFATGTRISGTSDKNGFTWPWPAPGSYTIWVADVDTSGNVGTPVSQTVTVDAASVGAGVQLVNDAGITITGNTATKTSGTSGSWDAAFHSRDGFTGGAFVSYVVPVLGYQLGVGLNTTPLTDNTNASVDYLLAVDAAGALSAYERSATAINLSTTAAAGDVLAVVYDGTAVRYLRNGTVLRTVTASIAAPLFVDSSFNTLGGKVTNLQFGPMTNIAGVTTAAANAQAAADSANATLASIASDNILSANEKPPVMRDYAVITGEQAGIDAQASAYSVTTEKTAYDNAVSALTTYLGTIPGWNVLPGSDVAIVGPTFRQKFQDVYTSRQDLLNKIAAAAGTLANWSGVSGTGKPLDNAGKTVDLGAATGVFGARDRNDPPIDYPFGSLRQFKQATAVGLSASDGTYCTLETIIQFTDDSGGPNVQYAYQGAKTWRRYALRTAAAWGAWTQDLDRNAYTGDLAATKNIVTYSTTSPATPADGDIWVNTGVVPAVINVRVGGVWQTGANLSTNTNQLTDGAGLGNTAIWTQVSGAGKPADNATRNQVTYSATAPAAPVDGDLWADTSVVPLVWRVRLSSAWQAAANYVTNTNQVTDGAGLGLTAVWASISGTGKPEDLATRNTVYYQTADPGAVPNGSIWITGGKSYQRVGAAWQPYVGTASVGTGELANQAATEVTQDNYAFAGAGTASGLITQRSVVYTPPIDCTISFSATIGAAQVLPDSANRLGWNVAAGAGADVTLGSCNSNSGNRQTFACATSFAATAGVALTFKLVSDRASTNPAILLYDSSMRIEAIKR